MELPSSPLHLYFSFLFSRFSNFSLLLIELFSLSQTASLLSVSHYETNPRSAILVDFAYFSLLFCKESSFTAPQTSALFSILLRVFLQAVDDKGSSKDCLGTFKELVLAHSTVASSSEEPLFSLPVVKKITDYTANTFFRYLETYQYAFTVIQPLSVDSRTVSIETPLSAPPLASAAAEDEVVVTVGEEVAEVV